MKQSDNPIKMRGGKGTAMDPKGGVASPKRDRNNIERNAVWGTRPILEIVMTARVVLKPPKVNSGLPGD